MQDELIHYAGQPVALVVADTLERSQHAASLVSVYVRGGAFYDHPGAGARHRPTSLSGIFGGLMPARMERGEVENGLADAVVRIEATYRLAANHHNPLEPSATIAMWEGDRLTLHDSTQGITRDPAHGCRIPGPAARRTFVC